MEKFLILFRGINVGGHNVLPMKTLVEKLKDHNFERVSTYIQSGNLVLKSEQDPTQKIKSIVSDNFGFKPELLLLNESEFLNANSNNPFNEGEGKFIHFYFCENKIALNLNSVEKFIAADEQYLVKDKLFYLFAPSGIGRSKLVANIEKCLGQKATGRNLNTINRISSMLNNA